MDWIPTYSVQSHIIVKNTWQSYPGTIQKDIRYLNGKATISAVKLDYKFVQKDTLWQKLKANCLTVGRVSPHGYNNHYSGSVLPLQHWNWRLMDIQHHNSTFDHVFPTKHIHLVPLSKPANIKHHTCFLKGKIYKSIQPICEKAYSKTTLFSITEGIAGKGLKGSTWNRSHVSANGEKRESIVFKTFLTEILLAGSESCQWKLLISHGTTEVCSLLSIPNQHRRGQLYGKMN